MTRVLIVDGDVEQARSLARAFSKLRSDLTILVANDGVQATKLIAERAVDLVLTELYMPEMNGFELLAWLSTSAPDVPAFAMCGVGDATSAAESLQTLGVLECFPKPLDAKAVLTRLTIALNQSVRGQVYNISLPSFLQLLELERKSCTLTVTCEDQAGTLVVQNGVLVAARTGNVEGQPAAIAIIAWPFPTITISRPNGASPTTIVAPLGFILMEAMRLQDEAERNAEDSPGSALPPARRTWRPSAGFGSQRPAANGSAQQENGELGLPSGASALAVVETATGRVLHSAARPDFPLAQLALMASCVLLQETETLALCGDAEGVEELVLSSSSRCDVIRPLSPTHFALLVFAHQDTNLMMARIELERFVAVHHQH